MNDKDYEYQETLMSLGEYRTTATVLAYMRNHTSVKSSELEHETGLRQPEVSIAMRELKERGWIASKNEKPDKKGRPNTIHMLSVSIDETIDWYQAQVGVKALHQQRRIHKLKELIKQSLSFFNKNLYSNHI